MGRIRKAQQVTKEREWKVALYLRLSREDGNDESLSVANQRKILTDYLNSSWSGENYTLAGTYIDDGLTGTDTNRENFMRMKQDILDGRVNCVIVKSLARAFRNLADQQKFLEEFLPLYKVRFINLGSPFIDTFVNPGAVSGFEVPIRGMFNEQYAAATSEEIRKTFNMKRSRGEFIGAFAPYGYKKHPENKNRLLIDEEAALVVKDIFTWFLYGLGDSAQGNLSVSGIAKELNERGVLSPIEYKRQKGSKYQNPNGRFTTNIWSPTTIAAILRNRMYTGCMVQGRQQVISYKIHKQVRMPESEWFVKENTHDAIIESRMFEEVQKRLLRDTRTAPGQKAVHLFSGFIKCADCGRALHRRGNKGYTYYYCRTSKQAGRTCRPRSIREDTLTQIVLSAIQTQISLVQNFEQIMDKINNAPVTAKQSERLDTAYKKREQELFKLTYVFSSLYSDWKSGDLSRDEYLRMKADYAEKIQQLQTVLKKIEAERLCVSSATVDDHSYFKEFQRSRNVTVLSHEILMDLVDVISVHQDGSVEIKFCFADQFQCIAQRIESDRPYARK